MGGFLFKLGLMNFLCCVQGKNVSPFEFYWFVGFLTKSAQWIGQAWIWYNQFTTEYFIFILNIIFNIIDILMIQMYVGQEKTLIHLLLYKN